MGSRIMNGYGSGYLLIADMRADIARRLGPATTRHPYRHCSAKHYLFAWVCLRHSFRPDDVWSVQKNRSAGPSERYLSDLSCGGCRNNAS